MLDSKSSQSAHHPCHIHTMSLITQRIPCVNFAYRGICPGWPYRTIPSYKPTCISFLLEQLRHKSYASISFFCFSSFFFFIHTSFIIIFLKNTSSTSSLSGHRSARAHRHHHHHLRLRHHYSGTGYPHRGNSYHCSGDWSYSCWCCDR